MSTLKIPSHISSFIKFHYLTSANRECVAIFKSCSTDKLLGKVQSIQFSRISMFVYIYERHCRVKDTVFSALVLCALHARQGGSHTPEKLQGTTNKALLLTCTDQNNHAVDQT